MRLPCTLVLAGLLGACGEEHDESATEADGPGKSDLAADEGGDEGDTGEYDALPDIDGDPFEPDSIEALYYPEEDPVWVLTAKSGSTWVYIENYPRFGGATGAETRTLGSDEVNYATCGVCVLLKTGCSPHGDHAHCSTTYMPEPGSRITFDELGAGAGDTWSGSVSPVRFVEVSMNSSTFETTPVEGGEQIELDAWSFEAVLTEG